MDLCADALDILKENSRTFYIPISRLPPGLQEAVASAYLCMRAIDETEDHPDLDNLRTNSRWFASACTFSYGNDPATNGSNSAD